DVSTSLDMTKEGMRILIAPDKFKGTLSAREVAENIAAGLRDIVADAKIDIVPMADGGEGTAEVISQALGGSWLNCRAHDPLGREIGARYAWIDNQKLAVMEMSEAAGMRRLRPNEFDVDLASTYGVGEMILDAARRGAQQIIIGLGGSATNDGGFGMARALGFQFFADEKELSGLVTELVKLTRIESPRKVVGALVSSAQLKDRRLAQAPLQQSLPKIVAAVDVGNPLLGENGATRVFGPQKGVTPDQIEKFERALTRLADVVAEQFGFDRRDEPGAGAAGGLGFGLMSFCGAKIRPGFDVVAESVGLESKMKDVDLVITGEGSLDRQTLEGKTPAGVARLARKLSKRVFAMVGRATEDRQVREIFDGIYQNARPGMSNEENMKKAAQLLHENALALAKEL
ncbi:MAG: glycerate kinase, partial [Verrucomicrobiota bacterium]|nr:glycerate kinase [Verrucomicrobiota bacterium]